MNSTFAMRRLATDHDEGKRECDTLDVFSKWFIATRSAVGAVILYSGLISGLLAWQYTYANGKPFSFIAWVILTLGLFIPHGLNNMEK